MVVSGGFALLGAFIGARLQNKVRDRTAREERIDSAIRSVALALASGNFLWSVGMAGAPASVTLEDESESSRAMYLKGIERHMTAMHQAKHDLAILTADGVATGLSVNVLNTTLSMDDMEQAYEALRKLRAGQSRS